MSNTRIIENIMEDYAQRTGLTPSEAPRAPKRYLWTDAFGVCNYLELYGRTREARFLQRALKLVDQVHWILGRYREDDDRKGWISRLSEEEGQEHPTRGGLRIGKTLRERGPNEPLDESLEWERDGQYFHYLTKWTHALDRVAHVTGRPVFSRWALELAKTAHAAFTYSPSTGSPKRMVWKMSTDLSRPLIPSMGHHDPLDGWITYHQVEATAKSLGIRTESLNLQSEIDDLSAMCEGVSWQTHDALGIGCLLMDACRLAQVMTQSTVPERSRLVHLLEEAAVSLEAFARFPLANEPIETRLAFRELGLSIGLRSLALIDPALKRHSERAAFEAKTAGLLSRLGSFTSWAEEIEAFWLKPESGRSPNWSAHEDINAVMLATSLGPRAYLQLF